jgi:integrase
LLLERRRVTDALQKKHGKMIPLVFYRGNGERIVSLYKAWHTACRRAGVPGRTPHDMCRSSARNMVTKRGVPQRVAQDLMGRRSQSVFERYHIVSPADLQEGAAQRTARHVGS